MIDFICSTAWWPTRGRRIYIYIWQKENNEATTSSIKSRWIVAGHKWALKSLFGPAWPSSGALRAIPAPITLGPGRLPPPEKNMCQANPWTLVRPICTPASRPGWGHCSGIPKVVVLRARDENIRQNVAFGVDESASCENQDLVLFSPAQK